MTKEQRLILVGILEESKERTTSQLLESILLLSGYEVCYKSQESFSLFFQQGRDFIFLMNIEADNISAIKEIGIKFDIIIHTFLEVEACVSHSFNHVLESSKYIIINSDEKNWSDLLKDIIKPIVITYGLNNKASVNLSSYNIHDITEANIYLQRKIQTIHNNLVEPFELSIRINTKDKLDIYLIIAVILCSLVIENDIFSMESIVNFGKMENGEIVIKK